MWNVECGTLYEIYSGTYHLPSISIYLRANTFSKQSEFVVLVVQYFIFISRSKYYDDATTSTHEDAKRDDDLSPVETKSTRFLIDIFVDRNAVRDLSFRGVPLSKLKVRFLSYTFLIQTTDLNLITQKSIQEASLSECKNIEKLFLKPRRQKYVHLNCNTNKSIISNSIKIKIVSTILLSASYQRVML
jgi:hypothetical protein